MEKKMMRTVKVVVLAITLLAGFAALAQPQPEPRMELQAGYTFTSLNPNFGPSGHLHGWTGGLQFNVNRRLGFVGEAGGSFKGSDPVVNETLHSYMFGPRVYLHRGEKLNLFSHALAGVGYLRASRAGAFDTSRGFSSALGGGVDLNVTKLIGVRLAQADYLLTRFEDHDQHSFRFSAGVVFRFGGESKSKK